jgi:arylsulfatase A-like enzyme
VSTRPNILWIVTTQWRAGATGYAGDPNARTPALDEFASHALNYTQAVTPHPFGPFARAALLTGVSSPANGVRDYHDPLPLGSWTVAHRLAEVGYLTAFFGKWHLARRDPEAPLVGLPHAQMRVPVEQRGGFHFWEGFEGGFQLNHPWLHGTRLSQPVRLLGYQSDVLCAWVADWIEELTSPMLVASAPWFAVVSLEPPHPPYHVAMPPGLASVPPKALQLPGNVPQGGEAEHRARQELSGYYAQIEATDRAIGRLLQRVPPDTVVVFTSVHGDQHGAHGCFRKGWPYEESVRVPLLVRGVPGGGAGSADPQLVTLADLPAMSLAWAEGKSWRTTRKDAEISMPSVVRLPNQCPFRWRGKRSASRKLIYDESERLVMEFDLAQDPLEQHNLVTSR